MDINQINYYIDNFGNLKWEKESLKNFVDYLSTLNLDTLDQLTKQKVIEFLEWTKLQREKAKATEEVKQEINPTINKKSKKSKKILILVMFLIILVLGFCVFFFYNIVFKYSDDKLYCVNNDNIVRNVTIYFDENNTAIKAKRKGAITETQSVTLTFNGEQELKSNLGIKSLEYEKVKDFYLNKAYTCNGEQRRQIDLDATFFNSRIHDDKLYFVDKENTLFSIDLNGKNKTSLINNINMDLTVLLQEHSFIYDNYFYYLDNEYNFFKVNLNDTNEIIQVDNKVIMNKDFLKKLNLYDYKTANIMYIKLSIKDKNLKNESPSRVIYNNEFIRNYDEISTEKIYMGNNTIYESENKLLSLSVNENYLYFLEHNWNENNTKIVKFDLDNKIITDTIDAPFIASNSYDLYDYSNNGIVYLIDNKLYKLDYSSFTVDSIFEVIEEDSRIDEIYYIDNKIVISYIEKSNYDYTKYIMIYDGNTKKLEKYQCDGFQISGNYIYLLKQNENNPITKIQLK